MFLGGITFGYAGGEYSTADWQTLRRGVERAQRAIVQLEAEIDSLRVEAVALPESTAAYGAKVGRLIGAEAYSLVGELVDDPDLPLDDDVRPRIQLGRDVSAAEYLTLLRTREDDKRGALAAIEGFDAWLTPTLETPALALVDVDQSATPGRFTRPINWLDWCALALPCGFTAGGLPLSLQIVCRGHHEAMALRIGWAYQQATDWHRRAPPEPKG